MIITVINRQMKKNILTIIALLSVFVFFGQEEPPLDDSQNRESMAMDVTATQWSFQLAYQSMPDYYSDDVDGVPRSP